MITVLHVDDEPEFHQVCKKIIESSGGFSLDYAASSKTALDMLSSRRYDVILADYHMPGMNGIEFLKKIRSRYPRLPFILFSCMEREHLIIEALNEGADYYVEKTSEPVSLFAELIHKIRLAVQSRRDEDNIHDLERLQVDILNFLPDATFAINNDGVVIAWNRAMEQLSGIPASGMLGKGEYEYSIPLSGERQRILIDLIDADDADIGAHYQNIIRKDGYLIATTTLTLHTGQQIAIMGKAGPLYDKNGEHIGTIESIRDISRLDEAERDLKRTNEYLESLIRYASIPIIVWDADLSITRINHAGETLFMQSAADLIGTGIEDLIDPPQQDLAREHLRRTITGIPLESLEIPMRCKDGSIRTVIWNSATISDPGNTFPVAVIGIGKDVSEEKRLKEQLSAATGQVKKNLAQLAILNDGIRNPLAVVMLFAESHLEPSQCEKITNQIALIDNLIQEIDKRWVESEKIIRYLERHHGVIITSDDH